MLIDKQAASSVWPEIMQIDRPFCVEPADALGVTSWNCRCQLLAVWLWCTIQCRSSRKVSVLLSGQAMTLAGIFEMPSRPWPDSFLPKKA